MRRYLNLGCGDRFLSEWTNVDLSPSEPGIISHDLSRPLPFLDNSFDVLYLSHVLEHFDSNDGLSLLGECYRVCAQGGVIRVVVPDLETIVRLYLRYLDDLRAGNEEAISCYDWMTLELYDQTVRTKTGGEIISFVRQSDPELSGFLQSRIGPESYASLRLVNAKKDSPVKRLMGLLRYPDRIWYHTRSQLTQLLMWIIWGKSGHKMSHEVLFRQQGEIHRWMYDRFSLARVLNRVGFQQICFCTAHESQIAGWDTFHLDVDANGTIHKPDSLFCESIKL